MSADGAICSLRIESALLRPLGLLAASRRLTLQVTIAKNPWYCLGIKRCPLPQHRLRHFLDAFPTLESVNRCRNLLAHATAMNSAADASASPVAAPTNSGFSQRGATIQFESNLSLRGNRIDQDGEGMVLRLYDQPAAWRALAWTRAIPFASSTRTVALRSPVGDLAYLRSARAESCMRRDRYQAIYRQQLYRCLSCRSGRGHLAGAVRLAEGDAGWHVTQKILSSDLVT